MNARRRRVLNKLSDYYNFYFPWGLPSTGQIEVNDNPVIEDYPNPPRSEENEGDVIIADSGVDIPGDEPNPTLEPISAAPPDENDEEPSAEEVVAALKETEEPKGETKESEAVAELFEDPSEFEKLIREQRNNLRKVTQEPQQAVEEEPTFEDLIRQQRENLRKVETNPTNTVQVIDDEEPLTYAPEWDDENEYDIYDLFVPDEEPAPEPTPDFQDDEDYGVAELFSDSGFGRIRKRKGARNSRKRRRTH